MKVGMSGCVLTEDARDDDSLDILCAGLIGVSREVGNVQTQGGVVTQDSIEIYEKDPSQQRRTKYYYCNEQ